jgi:hypothetical protein
VQRVDGALAQVGDGDHPVQVHGVE